MVSGSDVFPHPDTKSMGMAVGVVLSKETASEPCLSAKLKPHPLLTDTFNVVL